MREDVEEERRLAVELFELGMGYQSVAKSLGISTSTVDKWHYTYRALGKEALLTRSYTNYATEIKVAAAKAVVEEGASKVETMREFGIRSKTSLDKWCNMYREGGADALVSRKRGRKPKPAKPQYSSREEELEARVQELELELELQKRINALADEIEQRRHPR